MVSLEHQLCSSKESNVTENCHCDGDGYRGSVGGKLNEYLYWEIL